MANKTFYNVYRLTFPFGLHISTSGFGDESSEATIQSDTLFSAVCSVARCFFAAADIEKHLLTEGAVRLSSAFPFFNQEVYFPTPLKPRPEWSNLPYSDIKKVRRIKFLPKTEFENDINGNTINWSNLENIHFFQERERPRNTLDRVTNASQIYHFSEIHFEKGAGLFFIAEFKDNTTKEVFETALQLLGDEGIGSDGSIGKGLFNIEKTTVDLKIPDKPTNEFISLSLYCPNATEIAVFQPSKSHYDYITRGGWMSSGTWEERRQKIRMLTVGSILSFAKAQKPVGALIEVYKPTPTISIKRNGQTLALPINL